MFETMLKNEETLKLSATPVMLRNEGITENSVAGKQQSRRKSIFRRLFRASADNVKVLQPKSLVLERKKVDRERSVGTKLPGALATDVKYPDAKGDVGTSPKSSTPSISSYSDFEPVADGINLEDTDEVPKSNALVSKELLVDSLMADDADTERMEYGGYKWKRFSVIKLNRMSAFSFPISDVVDADESTDGDVPTESSSTLSKSVNPDEINPDLLIFNDARENGVIVKAPRDDYNSHVINGLQALTTKSLSGYFSPKSAPILASSEASWTLSNFTPGERRSFPRRESIADYGRHILRKISLTRTKEQPRSQKNILSVISQEPTNAGRQFYSAGDWHESLSLSPQDLAFTKELADALSALQDMEGLSLDFAVDTPHLLSATVPPSDPLRAELENLFRVFD
jgi:hypothetical protein